MNSTNQEAKLKTLPGPWSLGEMTGNWRDIDLPDHGAVMRIVWKMEDDEGRNEALEAQAHAVVAALNAASHTPMAGQQVIIDFAQVGTAGPFPVVNGHVKLPDATMQDLARMLRPTYEAEQQAALKAAPLRACVCGESQASGTVHRVDGPCYVAAPRPAPAPLSEREAFEAWYKQDCAVAGAAAKMAAKSAWHARAALAASPTPPAEQQATKETSGGFHVWRDISTAPKDGSRFVATGHNYGLYSEVRHACVAQWFRGCWIEASDWNQTSELKYLTHWMPLPSPPDDVAAPAEQQAAPKAAPAERVGTIALIGNGSTTLTAAIAPVLAAPQQKAQEPALFVSAKQLADLVDPSHATGGSYLPARKTRAGLFTQPLYTAPQPAPAPLIARSLAEWHEQDGNVAWWVWDGREWAGEPAWIGTPNCEDWPGYHTHWTPHPEQPVFAALASQGGKV